MKLHLPVRLFRAVIALMTVAMPFSASAAPIYTVADGQQLTLSGLDKLYLNISGYYQSSLSEGSFGGAIYATGTGSVTIGHYVSVLFNKNYAKSPSSSCYTNAKGGAIYSYSGDITLSGNESVTFSGNYASPSDSDAKGGAIYSYRGDITLSGNGSVTFSGNYAAASSSASSYASGGAIYCNSGAITLSGNGSVTFSDNQAYDNDGGAIYSCAGGSAGAITLSGNESVTFSGNYAYSDDDDSYGGAIYCWGGAITLNGNGSVTFSGNYASTITASSSVYGGAIYGRCKINIRDNGSVVFKQNYEKSGGTYRLRGLYATKDTALSAASGNYIEFQESMYVGGVLELNNLYTNEAGQSVAQTGDIIFTGAYTEEHLEAIKSDYTEEELRNSQTSDVARMTTLYDGRLIVRDGAILSGAGLTVASSASGYSTPTVLIENAKLNHAGATVSFASGTHLEASGQSGIDCSNLTMVSGSALTLHAAGGNMSAAVLSVYGSFTMGDSLTLNISFNDDTAEAGIYRLMSVTSFANAINWTPDKVTVNGLDGFELRFDALYWKDNTLYLNYDGNTGVAIPPPLTEATWSNLSGTHEWDMSDMNWKQDKYTYAYTDGVVVVFGDTAAGGVVLVGELAPDSVLVNSSADYTWSGDGCICGATSLTKQGSGTLTINNANSYTGGTIINGGIIVVNNASSLGTGKVSVNGGALEIGVNDFTNAMSFAGNSGLIIGGGITYALQGALSNSGALTLTGSFNADALAPSGTIAANRVDLNGHTGASGFAQSAGFTLQVVNGGTVNDDAATITYNGTTITLDNTGKATVAGGIQYNQYHIASGHTASVSAISSKVSSMGSTLGNISLAAGGTLNANATANVTATGGNINITADSTLSGSMVGADITTAEGEYESTIDAVIGGDSSLTVNGGTITFTGDNTYTGGTIINGGMLNIGSDTSLGAGDVTLNGGTLKNTSALTLASGQAFVFNGGNVSGAITTADGAELIMQQSGSISGNLTLDGGSLSLNGLQLSVGGSLIINDTFDIILDSDLQPGGTYTLITTGSGITGDLSQLVAVSDALNSRVNAQFGIDGNNLTLTLVTQSAILNWAGGKKDVWQVGAGGWAEGVSFQNGDAVNFKDGTVSIVGDVQPGDILITPTKSLTFKTSYNKKTGLYSGRIVGEETSLTIDAAGPKGKVTMNDGNTYGGGTTILSGSVTTKGAQSFGSGDITIKGGILDLKSKAVANMIFLEGDAVIKGGKKFAGSLAVDGNLLKGSLLNIAAGQTATIFSGTINGTISGAGDTIITFNPEYYPEATAPVLDTKGKITTATLQLMENSQLIVSSKGLSMNSKVSAIEIDDGTLTSAGKISAYSLYMQGGELDVTNAKPMGISLKGAFEAESGANIDLYGGLTANQLTLTNADFTLAMDEADVTDKIKPKAQSISIKGKGVLNTITDSEVDIAGKMSVTGNLQLTDSDVTLHDVAGATKPKAQGLTVKGELAVEDDSALAMTGTLSAGALFATDSVITIATEDGLAAQNLKLTRKQVVKGVAQENLLTNSSVYVNGGMSVAGNLELNNSNVYLRDYSGKNKAKGLTVKGDLTLDGNSSIVLSGALSAKNLTLRTGSSLTLTAAKPGTVKVGGELTLEGAMTLDLGFSVSEKDFNKKKVFKIFSFKTMGGNLTLDSDLNELFGISSDLANLSFDSKGKAITLVVVDFEGWNEYVAEVQAEAQQITPESVPDDAVAEEETAEELLTAPKPVAAAAVDPLLRKAADTLVQSTWGTVNASRAFGDTIAARGAHATLLAEGKGAAWLSTMGGSSRISTDGERNGADFTLSGAAFGVEGRVTEKSTLGVAIGNSWGKVSTFSAFPVDQDSMHIGIYGNHTLTESLTLSWMATHTRTESELNLLGLPYEWAQDALQLDARLTWATAISDKTTLRVFGGLQYLATDSGESNGLSTGSVQNLRGELGIGASHKCSDSTLVFGELSFVGDMVRNNPTADLGGMRLRGSNPGRAGINLSVGAVHRLSDDWSLNASYSFELMQNVTSHSLNVGASYSF